ncbi:flagellar basal-body rod protein FlgC [Halanaerobium saccharolyticum]|uniref:Flagellar basal-body rod protein FlgC n=1 Tax=Halanaerobium saccharolyticum TaxID=43595 RepID=A0A4R7YSM0_9FIRM|nr:flagellar basal body rod protein FlgC [Halanaerobium saccharolyticum]RAK08891.1 flagellar basal-body rod protein FlgC [Halanaerobium saccharolyticum]TDV98931.1 flagellar basal-body rod protein FlgC [Halanaerobium saccharolyticum]TDX60654.1 flagellar basal-body rod protein FlgC [Halanaerobium saccharolyticum]
MFKGIDISASGLTAQRLRMDTISSNISNSETTRDEDGNTYRRKVPIFRQKLDREMGAGIGNGSGSNSAGVEVDEIAEDQSPFRLEYRPEHPDANEEGYVELPNVSVMTEMVNMIDASRAYEANIQAITNYKSMANSALNIST